ncbi:hypothetical protein C6369_021285 [Rhodococcus rhodochrous]|uniref:hypothetical protein n=1 Tax=Rhodococcus rhodochrous TaxID=1829 RepID=UPI000D064C49|nr:hypothetical protein [Rhodococcus rhodochrous]AYA26721.1 hypothetical protein C6369_021285 [Rhodococcus rhodochrous]
MTRDLSRNPFQEYRDSDAEYARMLVDHYGDRLRVQRAPNSSRRTTYVFDAESGWIEFEGLDQLALVNDAVSRPLERWIQRNRADLEPKEVAALERRLQRTESRRVRRDIIDTAYSSIAKVRRGDFDQQTWLVGCNGGVLDLAEPDPAKRWRKAVPGDMVLWQLPVAYDPEARSADWTAFKEAIFGDYLEHWNRIEGMYLIGQLLDAVFAIVVTQGGAGKGTISEVYGAALGEYGVTPADGYYTKEGQGKHSTDAADLQNRRAVFASEVAKGEELNSERVLQDTGRDRRKPRRIGADQADAEEWSPQFVPTYFANYMPKLGGEFHALDRRLHLFDMEPDRAKARKFQAAIQRVLGGPRAERDRFLVGVLAEMVDNAHRVYQLYQDESGQELWFSKQRPTAMVDAVREAIGDSDPFRVWWARRVVVDPAETTKFWVVDGTTKDADGNAKEPDEPLWFDYSMWFTKTWRSERRASGLGVGQKLDPLQFWNRLAEQGFKAKPGGKMPLPTGKRATRSYRVGLRLADD